MIDFIDTESILSFVDLFYSEKNFIGLAYFLCENSDIIGDILDKIS